MIIIIFLSASVCGEAIDKEPSQKEPPPPVGNCYPRPPLRNWQLANIATAVYRKDITFSLGKKRKSVILRGKRWKEFAGGILLPDDEILSIGDCTMAAHANIKYKSLRHGSYAALLDLVLYGSPKQIMKHTSSKQMIILRKGKKIHIPLSTYSRQLPGPPIRSLKSPVQWKSVRGRIP